MIVQDSSKNFENPETGRFNGTIIDIVDLGIKKNRFGEEKVRMRIIWVLDKNDSQGAPFRVMREVNATIADKPKKSNLYEIVEQVTGRAPSVPFDSEVLIGRSNELTIVREADAATGKVYANIKVIMPLPAGVVPPQAPAGFVRAEVKKAMQAAQAGAPRVAAANTTGSTPTAQPTVQGQAVAPAQPAVAAQPNQAAQPATPAQPAPATQPAVDAAF